MTFKKLQKTILLIKNYPHNHLVKWQLKGLKIKGEEKVSVVIRRLSRG
jgi:hypothetical protein